MDHIGIDVHKMHSQICILSEDGELIERRVRTEPGRFAEELGPRSPARILIESATESEWVARCLETLGHEVIVADPNFAPMYAQRSRKVKTDRRDARALAEACVLGAYRPDLRPRRHRQGPRGHGRPRFLRQAGAARVNDTLYRLVVPTGSGPRGAGRRSSRGLTAGTPAGRSTAPPRR